MRVAFYAPLKAPDHPNPSGDRRMAELLMQALAAAGHAVTLACRFRSWDGKADPLRQQRIADLGARLAERLIRRYRSHPPEARPQAWFTYHLYYKAPDHLGPRVADALGIPYLAAEPSHAEKRAHGPYRVGHAAAAAAIARADALILLNGADADGVLRIAGPRRCHIMPPFLGPEPVRAPRDEARAWVARELDLPPDKPWLLAVGMMRAPDKLASYQVLGEALRRLPRKSFRLIVVGDGQARPDVERALAPLAPSLAYAGLRSTADIERFHAAADLFVWPAVNEAYGMAILAAQAAGLAVIAGRVGGVPELVADGETGLLVEEGDDEAFAAAVGRLLEAPELRRKMGEAARRRSGERHSFSAAVARLDAILKQVSRQ